MPLMGKLEDVAIVDVLHLLSVARKTGVLTIEGAGGTAAVVLRNGDICAATHPAAEVNVGSILVERGSLAAAEVEAALATSQPADLPIVATLIQRGHITTEQGWDALAQLIERTVAAVRDWPSGAFAFEPSTPEAVDGFRYTPAAVDAMGTSLQTRHLLDQAVRVLDERNRIDAASVVAEEPSDLPSPATAGPPPPTAAPGDDETAAEIGDVGDASGGAPAGSEAVRLPSASFGRSRTVVVCTSDGMFRNLVGAACQRCGGWSYAADAEADVMAALQRNLRSDTLSPLVLDITGARTQAIARRRLLLATHVKQHFPAVPVLVLGPDSPTASVLAYRAGARVYLPKTHWHADAASLPEIEATLAMLLENLAAWSREHDAVEAESATHQRAMLTLRDRVLKLTRPGSASDVSLVLLKHVAEYFRRCVLFVVRPTDLLGLGGFGLVDQGETLSTAISGLRLPLDTPSLVRRVLEQREMHHGPLDDKLLHQHLFARIGVPAARAGLLLPLHGRDRPIALIYADHGDRRGNASRTETLEILACLASLSLELTLFRRNRPTAAAPGAAPHSPYSSTVPTAAPND